MAIDDFYPLSATISASPEGGIWTIGMRLKLCEHLRLAQEGNRDRESRLINRVGQLRRHFPKGIPPMLLEEVRESCDFFRSVGRKVDMTNPDPRFWVTARDGKTPRWL